jgi:DME family drug/metabolite transporter
LASAALFGTTGTVLVNAPPASDPYSVATVRLLVGGAILAAIAASRPTSRKARAPIGCPSLGATGIGALGVALFQLCYFLAVDRTGVAIGTVATIGSGPMFAGLIASAIERRLPSARWLVGTGLGIGGVALLGLMGADAKADPAGIALALVSGLGWAVFATIGKHQITGGRESTASMATMFCGGAVFLTPLLLWHDPGWVTDSAGALVALYLGVATVGLAYTLYGYALRHLPAPTVVTLTLLEPITAATLGAVIVHEQILAIGWVGVGLVLAGLTLVGTSQGVH